MLRNFANESIQSWDERRDLLILSNTQEMIRFAVEHWIHSAQRAIQQKGQFAVALSGGSTPQAIYASLSLATGIEWDKVFLFWSDERGVPPDHAESNYRNAMESGLKSLPIPKGQIFRMIAETNQEKEARNYEDKLRRYLGKNLFDLVMLGIGEDGHTASLFPHTNALQIEDRLVSAIDLPDKKGWRMTLTFPCINQSKRAVFYVLGKQKQSIVSKILNAPIISSWPASRIGTPENKALWVLDREAGNSLDYTRSTSKAPK